jgi:PHD/YefM family antitoxin component YafN of YafNO toxin-antitoxin module
MSKQLKQVINLSKKTGDRIIVFDNSEPEDSFVLMGLDQYESLINIDQKKGLTEKKNIDNIKGDENVVNGNGKSSSNWKIPPQIREEAEN